MPKPYFRSCSHGAQNTLGHLKILYRYIYIGVILGIMEKNMETTITGYIGFRVEVLVVQHIRREP